MAISKLLHIKSYSSKNPHRNLENVINYICKKEKTEDGKNIFGVNCAPSSALKEMIMVKRRWGKIGNENYNGKKDRQGYHFVISFSPDEEIDVDTCNKVVKDFISEYFKDEYQVIFATHTDTDHLHSHIVFNSVNLKTGYKYDYRNGDWKKKIQPTLNKICKKYSLSELNLEEGREEFSFKKNSSYTEMIKQEIDSVIKNVNSLDELFKELRKRDYKIYERGQAIMIQPLGMKRARRLNSLGEGYTKEELMKRISERKSIDGSEHNEVIDPEKFKIISDKEKERYSVSIRRLITRVETVTMVRTLPYSKKMRHKKEYDQLQNIFDLFRFVQDKNIRTPSAAKKLLEETKKSLNEVKQEKSFFIKEIDKLEEVSLILDQMDKLKRSHDYYEETKKELFVTDYLQYNSYKEQLSDLGFKPEEVKEKRKALLDQLKALHNKEQELSQDKKMLSSLIKELDKYRKREFLEKIAERKYNPEIEKAYLEEGKKLNDQVKKEMEDAVEQKLQAVLEELEKENMNKSGVDVSDDLHNGKTKR